MRSINSPSSSNSALVIAGFRICFLVTFSVITWLALTDNPVTASIPTWDKLNHLAAFLTLAFLVEYSFPPWKLLSISLLLLLNYGALLEVLQWQSGYRFFEWYDLVADGLGLGLYLLVRNTLAKNSVLRQLKDSSVQIGQ